MIDFSHSTAVRCELEEKLRVAEAFQCRLVQKGLVPDPRRLVVRRARVLLEAVGAVLLGMFASVMAVLMTFVIFNKLLHIGT